MPLKPIPTRSDERVADLIVLVLFLVVSLALPFAVIHGHVDRDTAGWAFLVCGVLCAARLFP